MTSQNFILKPLKFIGSSKIYTENYYYCVWNQYSITFKLVSFTNFRLHIFEKTLSVQMYQECTIRDMALLGRKVFLHLSTRQFYCLDCGRYFNETFDFIDKHGTTTLG